MNESLRTRPGEPPSVGAVEELLVARHGAPIVVDGPEHVEYIWQPRDARPRSILYKARESRLTAAGGTLELIYGDFLGGSLIGAAVKLSMLWGESLPGLLSIQGLQLEREVRRVRRIDSSVRFFMSAWGTSFYGFRDEELFVFETGSEKLDPLGEIRGGLARLIAEWDRS